MDLQLRGLLLFANGFFLVFLIALLGVLLPPRPFDPRWQLEFAGVIVNHAFLPLGGLLLVQMAASFDPEDPLLRHRRDRVVRAAGLAALGFLLLVPLQVVATWRAVGGLTSQSSQQFSVALHRLDAHRQAIVAASSSADLRERLSALKAPPLPEQLLAAPLPLVRQQLLSSLASAEQRLRRERALLPWPEQAWPLIQLSLQGLLLACTYGFCFAGAVRRPGHQLSLLQEWRLTGRRLSAAVFAGRSRSGSSRAGHGPLGLPGRAVDSEYWQQISGADEEEAQDNH